MLRKLNHFFQFYELYDKHKDKSSTDESGIWHVCACFLKVLDKCIKLIYNPMYQIDI